jgi:hypothetical protein
MDDYIDTYEQGRKTKGIIRLVISLSLLIGGFIALAIVGSEDKGIAYFACIVANLVGVIGMSVFILDDKEYVFPANKKITKPS